MRGQSAYCGDYVHFRINEVKKSKNVLHVKKDLIGYWRLCWNTMYTDNTDIQTPSSFHSMFVLHMIEIKHLHVSYKFSIDYIYFSPDHYLTLGLI